MDTLIHHWLCYFLEFSEYHDILDVTLSASNVTSIRLNHKLLIHGFDCKDKAMLSILFVVEFKCNKINFFLGWIYISLTLGSNAFKLKHFEAMCGGGEYTLLLFVKGDYMLCFVLYLLLSFNIHLDLK